jgi:hypothetical protein
VAQSPGAFLAQMVAVDVEAVPAAFAGPPLVVRIPSVPGGTGLSAFTLKRCRPSRLWQ